MIKNFSANSFLPRRTTSRCFLSQACQEHRSALLLKIAKSGQGKADMSIYRLFAAGNLRQIDRCIYRRIDAAYMSYHNRRIKPVFADKVNYVLHILCRASACTSDMMLCIMDIVKIKVCTEFFVKRSGKKVE